MVDLHYTLKSLCFITRQKNTVCRWMRQNVFWIIPHSILLIMLHMGSSIKSKCRVFVSRLLAPKQARYCRIAHTTSQHCEDVLDLVNQLTPSNIPESGVFLCTIVHVPGKLIPHDRGNAGYTTKCSAWSVKQAWLTEHDVSCTYM